MEPLSAGLKSYSSHKIYNLSLSSFSNPDDHMFLKINYTKTP